MATSTCDLARDAFLSNLNNKSKLIVLLREHFTAYYTFYQAEADADAVMVRTRSAKVQPSSCMRGSIKLGMYSIAQIRNL